MYIRTKIVKGNTYYQIVEGRREGGKVRQRVLCSLGTGNSPARVLKWRQRRLTQCKRALATWHRYFPDGCTNSAAADRERDQLERQIESLTRDIDVITRFLEPAKMVGTTGHSKAVGTTKTKG